MISYAPLWNLLEQKGISQYYLKRNSIGGSTLTRLKTGEPVSTNTLDALCKILNCDLKDIVEYIDD